MKRSIYTTMLFLLFALFSIQETGAQDLKAVRASSPLTIDGRLDEAAWKTAVRLGDFLVKDTEKKSSLNTEAYLLYDDSCLYIGVKCPDKKIAELKRNDGIKRDSPLIFSADCVELMIDPEKSKNDYYHIVIDAFGNLADRACTQGGFIGDYKWNAEFRSAVYRGADYWSCEFAIPFYSLNLNPKVGKAWGINVCRTKQNPLENSSIAKKGAFNIATAFPEVSGLEVDFSQYFYAIDGFEIEKSPSEKGTMNLTVKAKLSNMTGKDKAVALEYCLLPPSQKLAVYKRKQDLKKDEKKDFSIEKVELSEQGDYSCVMRVLDSVTKKTCFLKNVQFELKYTPLVIRLIEPWYKNAIFETQNIKDVIFNVESKLSDAELKDSVLQVGIKTPGENKALVSKEIKNPAALNKIEFPAASLPYGKLEIFASIKGKNGETVAEVSRVIRKLHKKDGELWLGKDMKWYLEGKPFFLFGDWSEPNDVPGFNAGTGFKRDKYIHIMLSTTGNMKNLKTQGLSDEDKKKIAGVVQESMKQPKLVAHFLSDEPEQLGISAKALEQAYNIISEEDPYHPVIVANDSIEGIKDYAFCADINGAHPYPVILKDKEHNDLSSVVKFIDIFNEFFVKSEHKQTVAYLHQGFNYGDFGNVNNRMPNYREYRDQSLLALICGSQGFIQFNWTIEHYPELRIGLPELNKELSYLGNIALQPDSRITFSSDSKALKAMVKEYEGHTYIFVCNVQMKNEDNVKMSVSAPGKNIEKLNVFSEGRSVQAANGLFTDSFYPCEVHIYTTAPQNTGFKTVNQIAEEIKKANEARRKQGNLVFQMYEGDGVSVTASSSEAAQFRRPDNALWHVVDGIIDKDKVTGREEHHQRLAVWHSLPDKLPDWLEIKLPRVSKIDRVVVYPYNKSLKNYAVQAFIGDKWVDLDKVSDISKEMIEHKFSPVDSDRIRIFITAVNGKCSEIKEVEIYGAGKSE